MTTSCDDNPEKKKKKGVFLRSHAGSVSEVGGREEGWGGGGGGGGGEGDVKKSGSKIDKRKTLYKPFSIERKRSATTVRGSVLKTG